ncbi:hypothetical protein EW145_g4834 [Phellinidium pouzarii]|uniref:SET domain-containing protein n=1 Tax=Phellinidium pouzarii TaxID=167371 RepID=A0A4S4L6Y1_9AGAM|nr:hypothetical protein EW145_g4834 [Phellinidium pouzarii]
MSRQSSPSGFDASGIIDMMSRMGLPHDLTENALQNPTLLQQLMAMGYFFLCRIISITTRLIAVSVAVEDPHGDVTKLAIYNYPCTLDASPEETDELFPIGTILAIREPTYKLAAGDGVPMIRVDSPSDIVFISAKSRFLQGVRWATGDVVQSAPSRPTSVETWKNRGVKEFKAKKWLLASICFTEGLKLDPNHQVSRLNRSEAYLRLGWFISALRDAEDVLKAHILDESLYRKAVFRAAKASYNIDDYSRTTEIAALQPEDIECSQWAVKARRRAREKSTGEYDWCSVFQDSQKPASLPDIANYCGPIEVKTRGGTNAVRGVFVTRDVKIGELLMVAKPIASSHPSESPRDDNEMFMSFNFLTKMTSLRSGYMLITKVVQRIWDDSSIAATINSMYAGPDCAEPLPYPIPLASDASALNNPQKPVVDIDINRIEGVISMNSFRPQSLGFGTFSKTSNASHDIEDTPSGLYELPSFCNHACLSTAARAFFGDVMVIHASQSLRKGDEVTLEYCDGTLPLKQRDKYLSNWRFTCDCLLCAADRADDRSAATLRSRLRVELSSATTIRQAEDIVSNIEKTYTDHAERRRCKSKPELSLAYHVLSNICWRIRQDIRCVRLAIKADMNSLEAVGIIITDRSISGRVKRQSTLPIDTRRGPTHFRDPCIMTVIQIVFVFESIGEKTRARDWMKVAAWISNICIGGGNALFMMRFTSVMQEQKVMHVAEDAL